VSGLSIGALAAETGSNVQTIRYYEQIGLLPPAVRTEGNQRRYDRTHVARLAFVRHSRELGFPLDAAYKPLVDSWAEREMKKLRTRFGSRMVPAKELLPDILKRREVVRAIAMVADQEPTTSERKHWTRFLNRDTAFYMGPEEIARVTRFPTFFIQMRRVKRGYYEMELQTLSELGQTLQTGDLTERYARLVEAQIRAAPPDWPWSHKRWKLKRNLYGKR